MNASWRELLYRVLDGEELATGEADALAEALRQGANVATAHDLLRLHCRLHQEFSTDDPGRVATSRDRLLAKVLLRERGRAIVRRPEPDTITTSKRFASSGRRHVVWLTLTSVAAVLLVIVSLRWMPRKAELEPLVTVARLTGVEGNVRLEQGEAAEPVREGMSFQAGQGLMVRGPGRVVVACPDGTRLELRQDTSLDWLAAKCAAGMSGPNVQKRFQMHSGTLLAEVTPQPTGRPLVLTTTDAEIVVRGTRLRVTKAAESTQVTTEHGLVQVTRVSDRKSVEVMAGFSVTARRDAEPFAPQLTGARPQLAVETSGHAASGSPPKAEAEQNTKCPAVFGKPRITQGHPCLLWDKEDIVQYRERLKTNSELKAEADRLKKWADQRTQQPLDVPAHTQDADGSWNFPAYKRGYKNSEGKWVWEWAFNSILQKRASDVSKLGVLYALSGDEKYAAFAKQILLALADAYGYRQDSPHAKNPSQSPVPAIADSSGGLPTRCKETVQDHFAPYGFDAADNAEFLTQVCTGYDLIYNLPAIIRQDRQHIEGNLIKPLAERIQRAILAAPQYYAGHARWATVDLYGVFLSGMTLEDQELTNTALYGPKGTKDKPDGGLLGCFDPACIAKDGHWQGGPTLDDHFSALSVLVGVAEVSWRHGLDLYGYRIAALKRLFDFPIQSDSFDSTTTAAADTAYSELAKRPGMNVYEYAFRRYRDSHYLPLMKSIQKKTTFDKPSYLPSLFEATN